VTADATGAYPKTTIMGGCCRGKEGYYGALRTSLLYFKYKSGATVRQVHLKFAKAEHTHFISEAKTDGSGGGGEKSDRRGGGGHYI